MSEQRDRVIKLRVDIPTYGTEEQATRSAVNICRSLASIMHVEDKSGLHVWISSDEGQSFDELPWDDFSDDAGEMWHAHDWRNRKPTDEGLHPDNGVKLQPPG